MDTKVTVDEKAKTVTIVLPIEEGKTTERGNLIIATTHGFMSTDQKYKGKSVRIGANVMVGK